VNIVITGAKGFIGSNLVKFLDDPRHTVWPVQGDILDPKTFNCPVMDSAEVLIHLAGANRGDYQTIMDTNVIGTYNAAMACAERSMRLVFSSSTYSAKSHYTASKRSSELFLTTMLDNGLLESMTIRFPKVFGPGCKPNYNSFVSTILHSIAKGIPYEHLIRDKKEILELVYVEVLCGTIGYLIEKKQTGIKEISSPHSESIENIISLAKSDEDNLFSSTRRWYENNDI